MVRQPTTKTTGAIWPVNHNGKKFFLFFCEMTRFFCLRFKHENGKFSKKFIPFFPLRNFSEKGPFKQKAQISE